MDQSQCTTNTEKLAIPRKNSSATKARPKSRQKNIKTKIQIQIPRKKRKEAAGSFSAKPPTKMEPSSSNGTVVEAASAKAPWAQQMTPAAQLSAQHLFSNTNLNIQMPALQPNSGSANFPTQVSSLNNAVITSKSIDAALYQRAQLLAMHATSMAHILPDAIKSNFQQRGYKQQQQGCAVDHNAASSSSSGGNGKQRVPKIDASKSAEQQIDFLLQKTNAKEEEIFNLKEQLKSRDDRIKQLKTEKSLLDKEVKSRDDRIMDLEAEIASLDEEKMDPEILGILSEENSRLSALLNSEQKQVSRLGAVLIEKKGETLHLQRKSAENDTLKRELSDGRTAKESLLGQRNDERNKNLQLEKKNKNLALQVEYLRVCREDMNKKNLEIEQLRADLDQAVRRKEEGAAMMKQIAEDVGRLRKIEQDAITSKSHLTEQLNYVSEKNLQLERELKKHHVDFRELQAASNRTQNQYQASITQIERLSAEVQRLQKYEEDFNKQDEEIENLKSTLQALQEKESEGGESSQIAEEQIRKLKTKNKKVTSHIKDLEQQLDLLNSQLRAQRARAQEDSSDSD